VVRPAGLEPAAYCSASNRSNPLSYERATRCIIPTEEQNVNLTPNLFPWGRRGLKFDQRLELYQQAESEKESQSVDIVVLGRHNEIINLRQSRSETSFIGYSKTL
jgi:hypothetical protein